MFQLISLLLIMETDIYTRRHTLYNCINMLQIQISDLNIQQFYGRGFYELQTNRQCRYEHRIAPVCTDGTDCSRTKCMYTHPNLARQNRSFLDHKALNTSQTVQENLRARRNPWTARPISQSTQSPSSRSRPRTH